MIAYQRAMPKGDVRTCSTAIRQQVVDIIIGTSFTGVQNLKKMFDEDTWHLLRHIPLMVVSERIKMLANDLGFQTIWVARNASHQAILEAIAQRRDEICQIKQTK